MSVPTHDHSLEKQVLQVFMLNPAHRATYARYLGKEDFDHVHHQALWNAALCFYAEAPQFDVATLMAQLPLRFDGGWGKFGGPTYLPVEVLAPESWASPANAKQHVLSLKTFTRERLKARVANSLITGTDEESLQESLRALQSPIMVEEGRDQSSASAMADEALAGFEEVLRLKREGRQWAGLDCGFPAINDRLNGLCPGQLTVLAARPKIGKSTLSIQMALHLLRNQIRVGMISLEMTRRQVGDKLACMIADLDSVRQLRGDLDDAEVTRYVRALGTLHELPLQTWVKHRDIKDIAGVIRSNKEIELWIVDHLHRVTGREARASDHQHYGDVAQRLADLAVDTNKHIILVSQLNRECEDRPDKRPHMSDLRASGSIEEHAVNVLMIYRPGFYEDLRAKVRGDWHKYQQLMAEVQVICEATRFGVPGIDPLMWRSDRGVFAPMAA
jgi:replicative DNA helicase